MSEQELNLLIQIGQIIIKMQQHVNNKEKKGTLTGFEEIVKVECEEALSEIRKYVKDSELYA